MAANPLVPRPSSGPDVPRWSETLRDGRHVLIRPVSRRDERAAREFVSQVASQGRCYDFVGRNPGCRERLVQVTSDVDQAHDVELVAVPGDGAEQRIVGVGRYRAGPMGHSSEITVAVSDEWQEHGLGTKLMRHLADLARARGFRTVTATSDADDVRMHDLVRRLGFRTRPDPAVEGRVVHELVL